MLMKFYHWTTKENREKIKSEWVLRWIRNAPSRCTYLAVDKEEAKQYGDVVLEVEYDPKQWQDNYCEGCWQMRVYIPIPINDIKEL